LIQTTAPLSPGSSGGPLFNMQGRVIGITTAQLRAEGAQNLNFAVPVLYVRPLLEARESAMSLEEFSRKAAASASSGASTSTPSSILEWRVVHDHRDFRDTCTGRLSLFLGAAGRPYEVSFVSEGASVENWRVVLSAVQSVTRNARYGRQLEAFTVRLIDGRNYNLYVIDPAGGSASPETLFGAFRDAVASNRASLRR
jgi:hypothetical protein